MIVNALYIICLVRFLNDANIITINATIGTSTNKQTQLYDIYRRRQIKRCIASGPDISYH